MVVGRGGEQKGPSLLQQTSPATLAADGATALVSPAAIAAQLAVALTDQSLVYIAADETRAATIAALATAFASEAIVVYLPASDALPGDDAPASPANVGQRVAALRRVRTADRLLLVASAEASAVRYPVAEAFDVAPPRLAVGDSLDAEALLAQAEALGYGVDERVDEPGEIAVRGGVIDLFPIDRSLPVRIEVADGAIVAVRDYDPITQLGRQEIGEVEIGHATEPAVEAGVVLLDHAPAAAVAADPGVTARRDRFLALAGDGLPRRRATDQLVAAKEWAAAWADRQEIALAPGDAASPRFVERSDPVAAFARFARAALKEGKLVLAGSARDLRFLSVRLAKALKREVVVADGWTEVTAAPAGTLLSLVAPLDHGFAMGGITVVAAADLLGGRAGTDDRAATTAGLLPGGGEWASGDVVVHETFGIGVVEGLETLSDAGGALSGDAISLRYAKEGRRLVPVSEADRLWRYGADADAVTLDALDGSTWQKRRGAIDAAIAESARALAAMAAEREAIRTDPILPPAAAYERFAAGFPFTETPDQARAIVAALHDLASGAPMNRLVVGDVGYGKTEVALRAAAAVALAGRQVAVAAPTTVLVRQHIETFRKRFANVGVEVAGLSRLSSAAEKKRVIAGLADGSIGVVIGTGAVAGKGVAYKDLALVVIDEEQRFGAADKAKLQGIGAGHVLTLSATPIPRTLQAALVGLQPISVIATPPAQRQPIRTAVSIWDDATVRAALRREKARGGQSFVVAPRIEDMAGIVEALGRLVPELSAVQAHGKMAAADLDEAMVAFAEGQGDVLLATNIIEAGLDVPRANTMIVHHADRFGLSQLHQLRGRVGRSGRRGQILLLTDPDATIAPATLKRLKTLEAFDRLGAGFAISARDLDLRGAGDLVGEAQAGHMKLIGIDLYQHLFGLALRQARGQTVEGWTPELHLELAGRFPEAWVPEVDVRLSLYGRLARLRDAGALDAFTAELEDRFGALPQEAADLLTAARIGLLAAAALVARVDAGPAAIAFTPRRGAALPADIGLVERNERWIAKKAIADPRERAERAAALLEAIGGGE